MINAPDQTTLLIAKGLLAVVLLAIPFVCLVAVAWLVAWALGWVARWHEKAETDSRPEPEPEPEQDCECGYDRRRDGEKR